MTAPDTTVELGSVLRVLRTRWRLWLLLILIPTLAGLGAALIMQRRYEAELVALPQGAERSALLNALGQFGGLASLAGLGGADNGQRAEAIQMLQSQILARQFIGDHNLVPVLFASEWDQARNRWKVRAPPTLNDAVEYFDHRVRDVIDDRRTGLVTVRITWTDPVQAAAWANELVQRANDQLRRRAVTRAQQAIDYLKREARATETVEVQQALYRLMEEQYKTLLLANVSEDYAFSVIDPAVAPDITHPVFPSLRLFTLAGLFLGAVLVLTLAFIEASRRSSRN